MTPTTSLERLARLRLIAITDLERVGPKQTLERWQRLARAAQPASVAVDLRDRRLSARQLLELGRALCTTARAAGQTFLVNDRLDLALLLRADGVHLGEAGVETADARALLPAAFVIRACHAPERVTELHADAVLLSPILEARKANPPLGPAALTLARRAIDQSRSAVRLFALGGVDTARAPECIRAGAHGVAAIGAVFAEQDASALIAALGIQA